MPQFSVTDQALPGSLFKNLDLSDSKFDDINFARTTIQNVNLADSKISDVNFSGASFNDVNLSQVVITNARITGFTVLGFDIEELIRLAQSKSKD